MNNNLSKQLIEITKSMRELHGVMMTVESVNQRINLLADCQDAALAMVESIESSNDSNAEVVYALNQYCETLFAVSQNTKFSHKEKESLDKELDTIVSILDSNKKRNVVFFPYNASMWDSLESIWIACKDDVNCSCKVVPIPYYKYNSTEEKWEYCYDGELFPKEVEVTLFSDYDIGMEHPDIAYIHNPYDDMNAVTSVHPDFYSKNIKNHVDRLVYVPYYVTSGFITPSHLNLPVYDHIDYMIVQSNRVKESFRNSKHDHKVIPLGSPKFDRVIRKTNGNAIVPPAWNTQLKDKTVFMLNTSIGCLLTDGALYLEKIEFIKDLFDSSRDVALIWRPHPLLEATVSSMRPNLLEPLKELYAYFDESSHLILDRTSDISTTIALSDAYLGEEGSSVVNLFAAINKPVFILDNTIVGEKDNENQSKVMFMDLVSKGNDAWFTMHSVDGLFKMDLKSKKIIYLGHSEGEIRWQTTYQYLDIDGDNILMSPKLAHNPVAYNRSDEKFIKLMEHNTKTQLRMGQIVSHDESIFFLPEHTASILEYSKNLKQWKVHSEGIKELIGNENVIGGVTWAYEKDGDNLLVIAEYTNRVLVFNMIDGTHSIEVVDHLARGYSGILKVKGEFWLSEVKTGQIVRWNPESDQINRINMPDEYKTWPRIGGMILAHMRMFNFSDCVITIPGFSNSMVRVDKKTHETKIICKEFWKNAFVKTSRYNPEKTVTCMFGKKIDENKLIVQRFCDGKTAIINVSNNTYQEFMPVLEDMELSRLLSRSDGFERTESEKPYSRVESKYFPVEDFINDVSNNKLEFSIEENKVRLAQLANNLDGTAGEKIHKFVLSSFTK